VRIFIQNSDSEHMAAMAESLAQRGDDVEGAEALGDLQSLAVELTPEGLILELTPEALAWATQLQSSQPALKCVYLTPRANMSAALDAHPGLSILPSPGTALAARCLLSPNPAEDEACALGDHQLLELEALGRRTHIFRALQRSIHRPVVLRLLNQDLETNEEALNGFLDDARAKAAVTHDRVGAVYQALDDMGAIFYTAEILDGPTLADLARSGGKVDAKQCLEVARTLASALAHLRHIHLSGSHGLPRLANQATSGGFRPGHHAGLLQLSLSQVKTLLNPGDPLAGEFLTWFDNLSQRNPASVDLAGVVNEIRQLSAHAEAVRNPTPPARPTTSNTKSPRILVATVAAIALVALAAFLVNSKTDNASPAREIADLGSVVPNGGGQFTHPTRGEITVAPFNVDRYEVTIREYALFLEANGHTEPAAQPGQPAPTNKPDRNDHKPAGWDVWFPIAQAGGKYEGHRLTLDCPVFNVDWWDAQAYATWKNRRLPTQDEWELAARGKDWRSFPWGNSWDPAKANGANKPASLEGHDAWAPVDLPPGDQTPEGVHGLGGNVSEWTTSETIHPEDPNRTIPVVKGGSFLTKGEVDSSTTVRVLSRNEQKPWLGFRTAANLTRP
jgi:formylglycine-generating enzyme required for sulfatase activity